MEVELRQGIVKAFKIALSNTKEWIASLDGLSSKIKKEKEVPRLELSFIVEEVFTAFSDLNGDKAVDLDGFMIALWKFSWDIVKNDIMRMFTNFFKTRKFVKNLNTTFLVMIMKK